jgi:hypothetical protein
MPAQREARATAQFLGELAAHRIDDVDLAALQRREPRRLFGNDLEDQALDRRHLAPVVLVGLQHQLDAGIERDEFIGPGTDRGLFEGLVTDLFYVFLRYDPAGAGRGRVKCQEVRPWVFQAKADVLRVEDVDRGDPALHQVARRSAIAVEREFDVLGAERVAVVKGEAVAQGEIVSQPVFGGADRLGKARGQALARHRLHHPIVQGVKHHERRDDAGRVGRVEPCRRQRDMDAIGQLTGGAGCGCRPRQRGAGAERGHAAEQVTAMR